MADAVDRDAVTLDGRYVAARRALLDALEALEAHIHAVTVVGARAVYLRTESIVRGIAPFTLDGDLAINPSLLAGRRGVRLPEHGKRATRHAPGLQAALYDASSMVIGSLESTDSREIRARVAGEAALLVVKTHKIKDRLGASRADRLRDKDAGDVYRIMQTSHAPDVAATFRRLLDEPAAEPATSAGLAYLRDQFGRRNGPGIEMAARALRIAIPEDRVRALSLAYVEQIDAALAGPV